MKRPVFALLILIFTIQSCTFPAAQLPNRTPTTTMLLTVTSTAIPSPTLTATPLPTITSTPAPDTRVAIADQALFYGDYASALSEYTTAQATTSDPAIQAAALLGEGRVNYRTGVYPNA